MCARMSHDELVRLLEEKKIGYLRFVLESGMADDYLDWCRDHGTEPSEESAEFYADQTGMTEPEIPAMEDGDDDEDIRD